MIPAGVGWRSQTRVELLQPLTRAAAAAGGPDVADGLAVEGVVQRVVAGQREGGDVAPDHVNLPEPARGHP